VSPRRFAGAAEGREPEQVLFSSETPAPGRTVRIGGGEAEHARRSLRLRTGDPVHLVDGRGGRYRGRIAILGKAHLEVAVLDGERLAAWPSRTIWLGMGILRGPRMDAAVEKASELGVARFVPLLLERSMARPREEGIKDERWHRLAVESLKQSRRAELMDVDPPTPLDGFLAAWPADRAARFADPLGNPPQHASGGEGSGPLILVVGPEGGLSPREREALTGARALPISLGNNRLRAETAAVALLVSALTVLGELGAQPGEGSPASPLD
jgi:16S rRNA (uracil1498-N3)-methyltransferase